MTLKHHFAGVALASLVAIAYSSIPLFAQAETKWFVLRNHEVGNCWTATLVRIDGQYTRPPVRGGAPFRQQVGGTAD